MFVKINKPGKSVESNNSGSSQNLIDYLSKENDDKPQGVPWENFFNDKKIEIFKHEAKHMIDDASKQGLGKNDAKFYMLTINPSEKELQHLVDIASGHKKLIINEDTGKITHKVTDKPHKSFLELNDSEKKTYDFLLKDYTVKVMDAYAHNFDKNLSVKDLNFVAKLEHNRTWNHRDSFIIENKQINNEIKDLKVLKSQFSGEDSKDKLFDFLKTKQHQYQNKPISGSTFSKEQVDVNVLRLREKMDGKELLKLNPGNYDLKQKDRELDHLIIWTDSGKAISEKVINENKNIEKQVEEFSKYEGNSAFDLIDKMIQQKEQEKHKDTSGRNLTTGMSKEGLQSHVHVVVHRKTIDGKKISPHANSRGHTQSTDGVEKTIGFNHEKFKIAAAETFNQSYAYQSKEKEMYQPKQNTVSNKLESQIKSKIKSQVKKKVNEVMGKEFAEGVQNVQKVIATAKTTVEAGKLIASIVTANPTMFVKSISNISKEITQKTKMSVKQELKSIVTGKALGM